jgi:hypothetical protein
MWSPRAVAFLQTLERRPHVEDLAVVRDALLRNGVPAKDPFLEFHGALAGYVEPAYKDEFVYGIVHWESYWYGPLAPLSREHRGIWRVAYADAHPSYELEIDENGVMYQGVRNKTAASFVSFIEQHAFIEEFWNAGPVRSHVAKVPLDAAAELRDRLELFRVSELCDGVATVWATPGWRLLATGSVDWRLWMRPEAPIGELAPFIVL